MAKWESPQGLDKNLFISVIVNDSDHEIMTLRKQGDSLFVGITGFAVCAAYR